MRYVLVVIATLAVAASALAEDRGLVPWSEFKDLYRDSIVREVTHEMAPPTKLPQVHAIDEAHYTLSIAGMRAEGAVLLSGQVLSGDAEPIPLFGPELVITRIDSVSGGALLPAGKDGGVAFLPDGTSTAFQLAASFLVRAQDDGHAYALSFAIPRALRSSLAPTLLKDYKLLGSPGILDAQGVYHLTSGSRLSLRYATKSDPVPDVAPVVEVDTFTTIAVERDRLFLTTQCLPLRATPDSITLVVPTGAKFVSSSLPASAVRDNGKGQFAIRPPRGKTEPFTVVLALETGDEPATFELPRLLDNTGREGRFAVTEPRDGQVSVTGNELLQRIPAGQLGAMFARDDRPTHAHYMKAATGEPVTLAVSWFKAVSTPTTVLETQYFFSAFEENGNVLSVLVLDVLPEMGSRLSVSAVPDSEVWSLTVNGVQRNVFGEEGMWIIPLEGDAPSHVELAFLQKGDKLGLQGRLEATMPKTRLPSKEVRIGVALPDRVQLLSMEGPISPAIGKDWEVPGEFVGKPHFFSRSFYKGEGIDFAIAYKEPVKQAQAQTGGAK